MSRAKMVSLKVKVLKKREGWFAFLSNATNTVSATSNGGLDHEVRRPVDPAEFGSVRGATR